MKKFLILSFFAAGITGFNFAAWAELKIDDKCIFPKPEHPPFACFGGDSKISTPDGDKKISEIKVGDKVLSLDKQGRIVVNVVSDVSSHLSRLTCTLKLDDNTTIQTTPEHSFAYLAEEDINNSYDIEYGNIGSLRQVFAGFDPYRPYNIPFTGKKSTLLRPEALNVGERVIFFNSVKAVELGFPHYEKVYDITVEKNHNYFVNGVLVHNKRLL